MARTSKRVWRRDYELSLRNARDYAICLPRYFLFVGLQIDPSSLAPVLPLAIGLALFTAFTKILTGWKVAKWEGIGARGCLRAGLTLVARGEFSIIIAGLGASAEPKLAPLAAAYILILAVLGPVLTRLSEPISDFTDKRGKAKLVEVPSA